MLVAAMRCSISKLSFVARPRGFSQKMCLLVSAAAIVGSAWSEFGPPLSKSVIPGSEMRSCQSVVQPSSRRARRSAEMASSLRW